MYSLAHAAAAATIITSSVALAPTLTTGLVIGGVLGVLSHYPMDYLKEAGLADGLFKWDLFPGLLIILLSFISGVGWYTLLSFFSGNLMDIIDKKGYLATMYPYLRRSKLYELIGKTERGQKFIKWSSKSWMFFHKQKTGIKFSMNQTRLSNVIGGIILIINMIIFNNMIN